MNTKSPPSHAHPAMPALATIFYWLFLICLMLVFLKNGVGNGLGRGSGDGPSTLSGSGNAAEGNGGGAAEEENNGTPTDTGNSATTAPNGDTPIALPQGEQGAPEGKDAENTSTQIVLPTHRNLIGAIVPENEDPVAVKIADKQQQMPANIRLTGSQAGKMKGFFGSGTLSGVVIFLIDVSGSMDGPTPEGLTRLELLKREMKKALNEKIQELNTLKTASKDSTFPKTAKEGSFLIVPFSNSYQYFPAQGKFLSFSKKADLLKGIQFVDALHTEGGTEMKQAWQAINPFLTKYKIDKVYFLSDGEPTDCHPPEELIDYLKNVKQCINTFSLGLHSNMMQQLAQAHKGQYREIY